MYEPPEDDFDQEGEESEEIQNELWQEACWIVISAYFEEKGETATTGIWFTFEGLRATGLLSKE